jgi:hypothetical protein
MNSTRSPLRKLLVGNVRPRSAAAPMTELSTDVPLPDRVQQEAVGGSADARSVQLGDELPSLLLRFLISPVPILTSLEELLPFLLLSFADLS